MDERARFRGKGAGGRQTLRGTPSSQRQSVAPSIQMLRNRMTPAKFWAVGVQLIPVGCLALKQRFKQLLTHRRVGLIAVAIELLGGIVC